MKLPSLDIISPKIGMALGVTAVIAALGLAIWIQGLRLDSAKQELARVKLEYKGFVSATRALGEQAKARAKEQEVKDKKLKEVADAENKDLRRKLGLRERELRDVRARARTNIVPAPAPGAADPDRAVFSRTELERGIQQDLARAEEQLEALAGKGAKAVVDLNTARKWAQEK